MRADSWRPYWRVCPEHALRAADLDRWRPRLQPLHHLRHADDDEAPISGGIHPGNHQPLHGYHQPLHLHSADTASRQ